MFSSFSNKPLQSFSTAKPGHSQLGFGQSEEKTPKQTKSAIHPKKIKFSVKTHFKFVILWARLYKRYNCTVWCHKLSRCGEILQLIRGYCIRWRQVLGVHVDVIWHLVCRRLYWERKGEKRQERNVKS